MFGGKSLDPSNPVTPAQTPITSAPVAPAPAPVPASGFVIPDDAYTPLLPSPEIEALATDYWKGFRAAMAARAIIPSPANLKADQYGNGWQPYRDQRVFPLYRSESAPGGMALPTNDGWNDGLETGALYRYLHDTTSAHFLVS